MYNIGKYWHSSLNQVKVHYIGTFKQDSLSLVTGNLLLKMETNILRYFEKYSLSSEKKIYTIMFIISSFLDGF